MTVSFDEERGSTQYEERPLLDDGPSFVLPIDISDANHDVHLIDISSNKKWISYVTYHFTDNPTKYKIFVTRRRFTATNQEILEEELGFDGARISTANMEHTSFEITEFINHNTNANCKFLSISNDGKYVALSFYEKDYESLYSLRRSYINPKCLIFNMDKKVTDVLKIKCQGRAVFLNDKNKYPLAIISKNHVEIYADFPRINVVTRTLDLSCFYMNNRRACPKVSRQEHYINHVSWANMFYFPFDYDNIIDTENIIMFTRHIRDSILVTPFSGEGVVRIWSISGECARLSSFPALNQHIMAISKCGTYAAAYVEDSRSVNVYHVKSGILTYRLEAREKSNADNFEVSQIHFCYDARYVVMSGVEGDEMVVFEVWHLETEKSIYSITEKIVKKEDAEKKIGFLRRVEPFVTREFNNNRKCLKGYYTSYPDGVMTIKCVELDIDGAYDDDDDAILNWIPDEEPLYKKQYEIKNNLDKFSSIKCGLIKVRNKSYLVRIGLHTVQLWNDSSKRSKDGSITTDDELLYIRAHKGPDYDHGYSFRETWEIDDFNSIKYIGGNFSGRLIANIKMSNSDKNVDNAKNYHTEEIFLPLEELLPVPTISPFDETPRRQFNSHKLESACQALHYFFMEDPYKSRKDSNWITILNKTKELITSCISDIEDDCTFFSTITASRMLAMLASFEDGRETIKSILASRAPIGIFSYLVSQAQIDEYNDKAKISRNKRNLAPPKLQETQLKDPTTNRSTESNTPKIEAKVITYRSSISRKVTYLENDISRNENALTVLIDKLSLDLHNLLFIRIILDSKIVGPGCISSLTDTLQYLEKKKNHNLLLSSSSKLSYLEVDKLKLGILGHEYEEMIEAKLLQKNDITEVDRLEAHSIMEQIKTYNGYSLRWYFMLKMCFKWSNLYFLIDFMVYLYRRSTLYPWTVLSNSIEELEIYAGICSVPITHFNSSGDHSHNQSRHTVIAGQQKEVNFVQASLGDHFNDLIQQGDTMLELLLRYKWEHFARSRFILICLVHGVYYGCYCSGVLFAPELYGLNLDEDIFLEHPIQILSIAFMVISLMILIVQEFRQFYRKGNMANYFSSGYNWIDMLAFVLPLFTLAQLCEGWPYFVEVCSISTLILWTHAILRLRVISHFGITLEIIIQLSKKIAPLLLIMLLVILAFTQSYVILLRLEPDEYFRDTFTGAFLSKNDSATGVTFEGDVEFSTSSDNGFSNWLTALYNVWLFIYGVWDPIVEGDAASNLMVMALSVLFSLIAVLIFFNMVIAIMSSVIEEVDSRGKKVWVSHFAGVISEIELLWCFNENNQLKNNPDRLYYLASKRAITDQRQKLEKEMAELEKNLHITRKLLQ